MELMLNSIQIKEIGRTIMIQMEIMSIIDFFGKLNLEDGLLLINYLKDLLKPQKKSSQKKQIEKHGLITHLTEKIIYLTENKIRYISADIKI